MFEFPLFQAALAVLVWGALFVGLWAAEHLWTLREWTTASWQRTQTQVLIAVPYLLVAYLILLPLLMATAAVADESNFGLARRLPLPWLSQSVIAFLVIDYSLYWWHRATHRVPWLWRFHRVHHTDHDLSLSTALRFHLGEIICSLPFRVAVVAISGADVTVVVAYELALQSSVAFHHSNWDLSRGFDRFLQRFVVTPRLHGIHHSNRPRETDSNFSSVLTMWDQIHRTFLSGVRQRSIVMGVPEEPVSVQRSAAELLRAPFVSHNDHASRLTQQAPRLPQQEPRLAQPAPRSQPVQRSPQSTQ